MKVISDKILQMKQLIINFFNRYWKFILPILLILAILNWKLVAVALGNLIVALIALLVLYKAVIYLSTFSVFLAKGFITLIAIVLIFGLLATL